MKKEEIEKIAQAIAAKLGEPGGNKLLGCGDASSSESYSCTSTSGYDCSGSYECGGAARFRCDYFTCQNTFYCAGQRVDCIFSFDCEGSYSDT